MEKYRGSWSSFFTMPRAATASVGYWDTKSAWAAVATTVSAYCRAEGKPMARMGRRYWAAYRRFAGSRFK